MILPDLKHTFARGKTQQMLSSRHMCHVPLAKHWGFSTVFDPGQNISAFNFGFSLMHWHKKEALFRKGHPERRSLANTSTCAQCELSTAARGQSESSPWRNILPFVPIFHTKSFHSFIRLTLTFPHRYASISWGNVFITL